MANDDKLNEYWANAVELIKPEMTEIGFKMWILTLVPISMSDDTFCLMALRETHRLKVMYRYGHTIEKAILQVTGKWHKLEITIAK